MVYLPFRPLNNAPHAYAGGFLRQMTAPALEMAVGPTLADRRCVCSKTDRRLVYPSLDRLGCAYVGGHVCLLCSTKDKNFTARECSKYVMRTCFPCFSDRVLFNLSSDDWDTLQCSTDMAQQRVLATAIVAHLLLYGCHSLRLNRLLASQITCFPIIRSGTFGKPVAKVTAGATIYSRRRGLRAAPSCVTFAPQDNIPKV